METNERRAFILLRQLRDVCDVGGYIAFRESQLCSRMSARSGQKTSVIPIQTKEHQYQQYVQSWSYPKPAHLSFQPSLREQRESAVPNMWDIQTFPTSPISNLLQSAPSLNFRPELGRSVPGSGPVTFPGTSMANPNTEHRAVGTVFRQKSALQKLLHASVSSSEKQNF